jgi:signal peptidase I
MLKEYAEALIVALILAFIIRSFVVQAFKIPSGSMLQTLQIGDHLLVTKFAYGVKIPFTNSMIIEREGPERG